MVEIYDFYTKFKALSKLCVDNMRVRKDKRDRYMRKKKHIEFVSKTNVDDEQFDGDRCFTPKL